MEDAWRDRDYHLGNQLFVLDSFFVLLLRLGDTRVEISNYDSAKQAVNI